MVKKSRFENLAEPLSFTESEAILFCRDNVCSSDFGTLQRKYASYNRYFVQCLLCDNAIHEGEYISRAAQRRIEMNRFIGNSEMREDKKATKEDADKAMKDLGFE